MSNVLCIALHDVAPATWPRCVRLLAMLDEIGARAITLLVVPDFHRRGTIASDAAFIAAIEARLERGDEIALHGYTHVDEAEPPRLPSAWFRRRVLTASEGEFSALDRLNAAHRIAAGRDMLARIGWHVYGFVPPAWLASSGDARGTRRERSSVHEHALRAGGSSLRTFARRGERHRVVAFCAAPCDEQTLAECRALDDARVAYRARRIASGRCGSCRSAGGVAIAARRVARRTRADDQARYCVARNVNR